MDDLPCARVRPVSGHGRFAHWHLQRAIHQEPRQSRVGDRLRLRAIGYLAHFSLIGSAVARLGKGRNRVTKSSRAWIEGVAASGQDALRRALRFSG